MKDITVRTTLSEDRTKDGKPFNGGRTLPFIERMEELGEWIQNYTALAKGKNWTTMPDPLADMETGFRIRTGKEIRDKAQEAYGKPEPTAEKEGTPEKPVGVSL